MRKIVVKDYEFIESELTKLSKLENLKDEEKDDLSYAINGRSADNSYTILYDVKVLSNQLKKYFELTCKNFEFISYYDKKFTDAFKALVKNPDEFERFLDMTHIDIEEFIHIAVHIVPHCFTSNLIKFLKDNYLK